MTVSTFSPEPAVLAMVPWETPERFGRFTIAGRLGRGGMAEVLLARDPSAAEWVVLKRILPVYARDPDFVRYFLHEGRLGRYLDHPNVVRTLESGAVAGTPYLALEHLHGCSALELLRASARAQIQLPLGLAVRVVADVARGLHHAHQARDDEGRPLMLVHRDVTPHNLFVCSSGTTKLIDFGIARATSQLHSTAVGTIKGKVAYLAPEAIRGLPIDHRVDVFSLGIVLYELIAGAPLFRVDDDGETFDRILHLEVPLLEHLRHDVPPGLSAVAMRALQREPDRRLPSAAALADSIEAVAAAECIDASPQVVADVLAELRLRDQNPAWKAVERAEGLALGRRAPVSSLAPPVSAATPAPAARPSPPPIPLDAGGGPGPARPRAPRLGRGPASSPRRIGRLRATIFAGLALFTLAALIRSLLAPQAPPPPLAGPAPSPPSGSARPHSGALAAEPRLSPPAPQRLDRAPQANRAPPPARAHPRHRRRGARR